MRNSYPEGVELEEVGCPLGCPRRDVVVVRGIDWIYGVPGEFAVVRCETCGLMRTSPRPTSETIAAYYPSTYGPHAEVPAIAAKVESQRSFKSALRALFEFNTERIPPLAPGRRLEVGCATGTFLDSMRAGGWAVTGIERSENAAAVARSKGLNVLTTPIESAPLEAESFDLIVAWMALEHFHQPVEALRRLRGWVTGDGWLAASVPDASALGRRIFGESWYALGLPVHLFHFTPATLRKVLQASGWKLERVHHQRLMNNIVPSVGRALSRVPLLRAASRPLIAFPERAGYHNYALYPLAATLAALHQTGAITFWARPA